MQGAVCSVVSLNRRLPQASFDKDLIYLYVSIVRLVAMRLTGQGKSKERVLLTTGFFTEQISRASEFVM